MTASCGLKPPLKQPAPSFKHHAVVLMTALLPTTGHSDLIEFAGSLPETQVCVLVNGRSFEPQALEHRVADLRAHFASWPQVEVRGSMNDEAPQAPHLMPQGEDFWGWWREEIHRHFPEVGGWSYVVASEPYGQQVAESLGASFMPYDLQRTLNPAKSTAARLDPWGQWEQLLPETRRRFLYRAVLFGQESVGKTTLSRSVAEALGVAWGVEWARPFLETVGPEVTPEAMAAITAGQGAYQEKIYRDARHPAVIMDTDLFSTVGYYRICLGEEAPACEAAALASPGTHYFLLPDSIPFEADPLRYGGDHRESERQEWIDLLERFGRPYSLVPDGSWEEKTLWLAQEIKGGFLAQFEQLQAFQREA